MVAVLCSVVALAVAIFVFIMNHMSVSKLESELERWTEEYKHDVERIESVHRELLAFMNETNASVQNGNKSIHETDWYCQLDKSMRNVYSYIDDYGDRLKELEEYIAKNVVEKEQDE